MAHKTNYKDALFEQRKYRMQNNPDGTVTPIDETDYTQKGDRVGALELNEIGKALNALEQEMGKRELQTYTALSQLSLEAPVTLSQLITAMPDGSYAAIDCNGTSVVSDIPSGSAAGSLEVVKVGDSGSAKYTNTSNGQVYFWGNGQWYAALVDEMVLGTMEEIDANTDAGKVAGALAVKELSSEIVSMKVSFQDGCNAIYQACVNNGVTPSSNSPDAIVAAIEKISSNVVAEFCSRKFAMGMSETLTGSGLAGDIYILFSTGATTGTSLNVTGGSVIHSSNASYSGSNGAIWTIRSTAENISVTIKSDDKTLIRLAR